jgi:hypothetical protein
MTRNVEKKILSIEESEGVGAQVRRTIGTPQVCRFTSSFPIGNMFILDTKL